MPVRILKLAYKASVPFGFCDAHAIFVILVLLCVIPCAKFLLTMRFLHTLYSSVLKNLSLFWQYRNYTRFCYTLRFLIQSSMLSVLALVLALLAEALPLQCQPDKSPKPSVSAGMTTDTKAEIKSEAKSEKKSESKIESPFDRHPLIMQLVEWQYQRERDSLVKALSNPSDLIRARAALGLASLQDLTTTESLTKALDDTDPTVRRYSAFALGQLGLALRAGESLESAETALFKRFDVEPELMVRATVVEALGKCGGQRTVLRLTNNEELRKPTAPKPLLAAALLALARLSMRKVMPAAANGYCLEALRRVDAEKFPEVGFAASYVFARSPMTEQAKAYADALAALLVVKKYPAEVLMNIAKAFGKTRTSLYLEPLRKLVKSPDWRVRVECARAAGAMLGGKQVAHDGTELLHATTHVVSFLSSLVNDKSPHVRIVALAQLQTLALGNATNTAVLDEKTLKTLKSKAVQDKLDPRERGALLKTIAAAEPLWVWNERARWASDNHLAFQRDVIEAFSFLLGTTGEALPTGAQEEARKFLYTKVLKGQLQDLFTPDASLQTTTAANTSVATEPPRSSTSATIAVSKQSKEAQRKDILAAAAFSGLHDAWRRHRFIASSATTAQHIRLIEMALNSADAALVSAAAEALSDTLFLPFGSTRMLVDRLQSLQTPRDIEAMQAIMKSIATLKAFEGLPIITRLLLDPSTALAQSAADAFEALTGQRPQYMSPMRLSQMLPTKEKLREVWHNNTLVVNTKQGTFTIMLDVETAPLTCYQLYEFAKQGMFNGVPFHRVVPNFVVQGGDFERGDGYGRAPNELRSEFTPLAFERGTVGMASAGKDTEGSQWFVMHSYAPHLDGRYTAFGRVTDGMNTVDALLPYDEITDVAIKPRK